MTRRQHPTDDVDLIFKVALGAFLGGMAVIGLLYIRDKMREQEAAEQIQRALVEMAKAEPVLNAAPSIAEVQATRDLQTQIASRALAEQRAREVEMARREMAPNEQCAGRTLLRKDGEMLVQVTGQEAALKCGPR